MVSVQLATWLQCVIVEVPSVFLRSAVLQLPVVAALKVVAIWQTKTMLCCFVCGMQVILNLGVHGLVTCSTDNFMIMWKVCSHGQHGIRCEEGKPPFQKKKQLFYILSKMAEERRPFPPPL